MKLHVAQPVGIHLVPAQPSEQADEPRLIRGILVAFAIQSAAAVAVAATFLLKS